MVIRDGVDQVLGRKTNCSLDRGYLAENRKGGKKNLGSG
jgi:hypothetical protein